MNARVRIIRSNTSYDIEYTYRVPDEISEGVRVGVFVDVPFGAGNKPVLGVVVGVDPEGGEQVSVGSRKVSLKSILALNDGYRPLDESQMKLCEMMTRRYVCGTAEVCGLMTAKIYREEEPKITVLRLKVSPEEADSYIKGRRSVKEGAFAAIRMLSENPQGAPEKTVMTVCEISTGVIKRLADDGIVEKFKAKAVDYELPEEDEKDSAENAMTHPEETSAKAKEKDKEKDNAPGRNIVLNKGQEEALGALTGLLFSGKFSEYLLRGVTGSGKTEVYFRLIERALSGGFGVILLVPEIVLTEQMIKRVRNFFGDKVAVLHSRMSDKKRAMEYARIDSGEIRLVLGVRSAVFAPVKNLRLIILDEEQEPSFKSFDARPYYHAGEVAVMRMKLAGGLTVYGSATPRVTTFRRAVTGEIGYSFLKERAFAQNLPEVKIVDMKAEMAAGNNSPISVTLANEIRKNIEKGEQSIIFLPRRGYSSKLVCLGCGRMIVCGNCGIPMTYHKNYDRLVCHYCGVSKPRPKVCPGCGSENIRGRTFGTEFAENELNRLFPNVPVVRMDSDTTRAVDGHKKLLEKFENEKVPLLVGTQMVAKGLDFPNVTLVGIVNADSLMAIGEYTAAERAFQLLTQVAGRAGRDPKKPGRCVLQTMNPGAAVIRNASNQDYDSYAALELEYRRNLDYPPFASIATVTVSGEDDRRVFDNASAIKEAATEIAAEAALKRSGFDAAPSQVPPPVNFFKVTRSSVPKIDENFYWCFIAKSQDGGILLDVLNKLKDTAVADAFKKGTALKDGKPVKNLRISIDADIAPGKG